MLTTAQIERIITDAIESDEAQSLNRSPASIAAEKIAELTKSDAAMMVAGQALENEITSTLMDMLAATILVKLIEEEGGGRANIRYSPFDMEQAMSRWNYTVENEGMVRNVRISMKEGGSAEAEFEKTDEAPFPGASGLMRRDDLSTEGAKPQAEEHIYDRPLWAVKGDGRLRNCHDRKDAEAQCLSLIERNPEEIYTVENRHCLHWECPASGCNEKPEPEVTS